MKTEPTYKPVKFFTIVFLITWVAGFSGAYFTYQPGLEGLGMLLVILGMFAPLIGLVVMLSGARNKELRRDFGARLNPKKIKVSFLLAILLIMPVAVLLATALSLLFGQSADQFRVSSQLAVLDGSAFITVLILCLAPTVEEFGWRGYGVDSLRSKFDLFQTTLVFAVLWGLWHVPLFFANGFYQHELWNIGIVYVINFFGQILVATALMNWMYYKNNRSISAAILFHITFNLFSELFQTEQFTKCIVTIILLIIALAILWRDREFFFDRQKLSPALSSESATPAKTLRPA